jgi:hypothetical protein
MNFSAIELKELQHDSVQIMYREKQLKAQILLLYADAHNVMSLTFII